MPPAARTGPYATVSASPKRSGGAISPVGARRLRSTRAWTARASEDSCRRSSLSSPHPRRERLTRRARRRRAPARTVHRMLRPSIAVSHQRTLTPTVPASPAAPATWRRRRPPRDVDAVTRSRLVVAVPVRATALGAQLLSSCTGSPANCSRSWHPQCRHGSASQFYVAEWLSKGSAGASAASAAGARACLSVCLSVCLWVCGCVWLSVCLSVRVLVCL